MSTVRSRPESGVSLGFSLSRFITVAGTDFAYLVRRPLFYLWILVLVLLAFGMSSGSVHIRSGDTSVGGTKAWITSEFAIAQQLSMLTLLFYLFFLAIIAGMSITQDSEWRVGELLHATPLRPSEYVWGKFVAALVATMTVLAIHLIAMGFFFHVWPTAAEKGIRGPFHLVNYLRPAILFSVPVIVFIGGTSLAIGERTRKAILVFMFPLMLLLIDVFFLWSWSPGWLGVGLNRALMLLEPSGFRWLQETWLKVDRGVGFYNTSAIPYDLGFLVSRAVYVLLGLGAVALCRRHFASTLNDHLTASSRSGNVVAEGSRVENSTPEDGLEEPLRPRPNGPSSLGMISRRPGLLSGAYHVARIELSELVFSPGLYLFAPLILLQVLGQGLVKVGHLDTPLLITPGSFAVDTMSQISTFVGLLLLWYSVESLERERSTRLSAMTDPAAIRTGSLLLGKATALACTAMAIVLTAGLAGFITMTVQGRVPFTLGPIVLVWGFLLFPTLFLWTAFVFAIHTITRNRYTTYAVGLAVLCFTGYKLLVDEINWQGNWPLWDAIRWSDLSVLELDRPAIVLSRTLALSLALFFLVLTIRYFPRREHDSIRLMHRLRPRALLISGLGLAPWAIAPLVAGTWLGIEVRRGYEGASAKKTAKDYWRKNLSTYRDSPRPDLEHVELDVELFPDEGRFLLSGAYDLVNPPQAALRELLLTSGSQWEDLSWTLNGEPFVPIDRSRLHVFVPRDPLKPGQSARIGFRYRGRVPGGVSRRGGGTSEFILPSAVVLTSFGTMLAPTLGYSEELGVDDENRAESREYPDDFHEGRTDSMLGSRAPFTTRIKLSGPSDFTLNSVGTKVADTQSGGRRTVVWESDHPVNFYNIVGGRLKERRGEGTAIYYHPAHEYNVEQIASGLDSARQYYSEWFFPYPWRELKLTEFPDLATYAQGFPTNISFSEGVGFLTQETADVHFAFEITAHEAAHQWWGNIVVPGKGPGANILNEGMAHFSTILLLEQVKGPRARIDFCKRLETHYSRSRHPDVERPLVKIDGSRDGDNSVTYDKGAWVFWMLMNQMSRDRALHGLRSFIKDYHGSADHPVLQDLISALRPFAPDPDAYDAFTRVWFFEVVLPEYQIREPRKERRGDDWLVVLRLENAGTGTMPVEVAATRGQRFGEGREGSDAYRETRVKTTVEGGQSGEVKLVCPFEPESIVVDPDALILQLRRENATAHF